MAALHNEIRINAPMEAAWRPVADLVAVQDWNPMVNSARDLSDQREGVGAGRRCELKPKGWVDERGRLL